MQKRKSNSSQHDCQLKSMTVWSVSERWQVKSTLIQVQRELHTRTILIFEKVGTLGKSALNNEICHLVMWARLYWRCFYWKRCRYPSGVFIGFSISSLFSFKYLYWSLKEHQSTVKTLVTCPFASSYYQITHFSILAVLYNVPTSLVHLSTSTFYILLVIILQNQFVP